VTEIVGQTGLWDYIEFVAEYTPYTLHDLDNIGRAIELFPDFTGMIKVEQDTRGHLGMRAVGAGIQNLLFADVRTPGEALQCVRSIRPELPEWGGLHGVGMRRDVRTVLEGGPPEFVQALGDAVIVRIASWSSANLQATTRQRQTSPLPCTFERKVRIRAAPVLGNVMNSPPSTVSA
jgi:4-hydroxy-2-oxoheptanedioate aldolase